MDELSEGSFVVKAQPFYLNRIGCSVRIVHLILGMVSVSRQDVDTISGTVDPYPKFYRGVLYGTGDAVLVSNLDKPSKGCLVVEAQRFCLVHSARCPVAVAYLELGMVAVSGENVDRILRRLLRNNRARMLREY